MAARVEQLGTVGKLPSERVIAAESGAGRTTVRLVLAKLAAQGLIEAQHGRGYFVCGPKEQFHDWPMPAY